MIIRWDSDGHQVRDDRWTLGGFKTGDDFHARHYTMNFEKLERLRVRDEELMREVVASGTGARALGVCGIGHVGGLRRSRKAIAIKREALERNLISEQDVRNRNDYDAQQYIERNFGATVLEAIREAEVDGVTINSERYHYPLDK